jgi:hypothetical protein
MGIEIQPLKNEEQQPIPNVWRQTLREIVEALRSGNFQLNNITGVRQLSARDAERIAGNLESYGAHLKPLPEDTWGTSACHWMRGYWDALIDLSTEEEGASDLALFVRVYETTHGYDFQVESVHVP